MIPEQIDWNRETILCVLTINSYVKFGITVDWTKRSKAYQKELEGLTYRFVKKVTFKTRWQAELIEQVMKWRLRRWVASGRHEWIELPIQPVLDCLNQTVEELSKEFPKHSHIHRNGINRWDHYKQIAAYYFEKNN